MKKIILSTVFAACLGLTACSNGGSDTPPTPAPTPAPEPAPVVFIEDNGTLITLAANITTGSVLNFAETNTVSRVKLANEIYSSANAINSLATGQIPTVAEVQQAIIAWGGPAADANYAAYAQALSSVYGQYVTSLNGNSAAALDLLVDLSTGAQQAAAAYETVTTTPVTASLHKPTLKL